MNLETARDGKRARMALGGDIDEGGAEEMKRRFEEINDAGLMELVIDFSGVDYIGSAGIGKMLLFYQEMAPRGGSISIERVASQIHDLFVDMNLDAIFNISRA